MMRGLALLVALLSLALPAFAADAAVDALLPTHIGPGWNMDGKPATYDPQTLYKYIDGEAELYLPYGFAGAATVVYAPPQAKGFGVTATIFQMGSLLDAFGIYSNYRDPKAKQIDVGAEGFGDESQAMFYQDRYFVRVEASGTLPGDAAATLQSAAKAISGNLPANRAKPAELEWMKVPGALSRTERYYATGLLGHSFFGRGMTGEATVDSEQAKSLVIFCASEEAAKKVFDDYASYLKESKAAPRVAPEKGGAALHVIDPLFKGTVLRRSGKYIAGIVGLKDPKSGDNLTALLLRGLPKE